MTSAQSWSRRHHWLSWAGVIPIWDEYPYSSQFLSIFKGLYLVIQNISIGLSCKFKEGYEQYTKIQAEIGIFT